MSRIEHYNEDDAPAANNLVPAASAVVANDAGNILLIRRSDNGLWTIPGGAMEPGESIANAVVARCSKRPALRWRSRASLVSTAIHDTLLNTPTAKCASNSRSALRADPAGANSLRAMSPAKLVTSASPTSRQWTSIRQSVFALRTTTSPERSRLSPKRGLARRGDESLDPSARITNQRVRSRETAHDHVAVPIARTNLSKSLVDGYPPAVGSAREVAVRKDVGDRTELVGKVLKLIGKSTQGCSSCTRAVMSDETRESMFAKSLQVTCAVEMMTPGYDEAGRVTNVMQQCRRDEN